MLPLQVAYLTGQSDPKSCSLSAVQARFLQALPLPEAAKISYNFPYDPKMEAPRDVSLTIASWNNIRQYLQAMQGPFFRRYAPAVAAVVERAEQTVFLAGSSGVHLLRSLRLPPQLMTRVAVFAYGPVAFGPPACRHVIVGSTADPISRAFFPRPDTLVTANHLRYLEDPAVAAACRAFLRSLEPEL